MQYILALDQGTTSSRALLVDSGGHIRSVKQKEFKQYFPSPGFVEHDPLEIWSSQAAVVSEVLAESGVTFDRIAAIGITNQRETTILWDRKTSQPLAKAIVWQDRRTTPLCDALKEKGLEGVFRKKTGLLLDPYFSGTKIQWLLHNIPGALEKAKRGEIAFGTVDSWLVWKLTEGKTHITDVTNASRTLLFNIHTKQWDEELLEFLGIPKEILPMVVPSSGLYASTSTPLFSKSIPIAGIAGDQQAALFGQAAFASGMVKTTYGTGCFMLMHTGEAPVMSKNKLLTTIAYEVGGKTAYALEGSVFMGGAVVQWLRDNLKMISKSSDIDPLAESVPDSQGVYFVPAFTGLGAPHWNPLAKGSLFGLTRGTTTAHIARAALEGIAFQVNDLLHAMQEDAGILIKELRVDGGATRSNLLMQFQSDLLRVPLLLPQESESTALGAAFLAGLAVSFWKDCNEISSLWKEKKRFRPEMEESRAEKLTQEWQLAVRATQMGTV